MRLLVFGPGHPFRGGIARTTTDLVLALRGRGHEVEFLTPLRQYPRWLYPGRDDRDPEACPRVEGARPVLEPFSPWRWGGVRRAALELPADVWIFPYWTWAWAPWWRFLLSGPPPERPPAVVVVHNAADHERQLLQRFAGRMVLGLASGLFTHGELLAEELRRSYFGMLVRACPLAFPRPGAGPPREAARRELGVGEGVRLALFVGLIRPYKGVEVLLRAFARLPDDSPWRLLVAGEPWGGLEERLRTLHRELGLEHRVGLDLAWVPESGMPGLLAAADVVVLPYLAASQSAVVPLAMAHGVPVVSTAAGSITDVVRNGYNGLVVPPGDEAALAAAFASLDGAMLARLREGVARTVARFTRDRYAAELEALLDEVVQRGL